MEEVQRLNQENVEKSEQQLLAGVSPEDQQGDLPACSLVDYQCEESQPEEKPEVVEVATEVEEMVQDEEELIVKEEEEELPALEEKKDDRVSSVSGGHDAAPSSAEDEEATASR